ncbi:unnamed protein product [marine sediment metagenome]|uniref:BioF2-like acetyltransferase domain-containing protein n=1 Tax=marine sediment metagenome TaxID=412755 RepID=X1AD47_9ZZZZ
MYILELNNKEVWGSFLLECQEKTFLDSWNWGEFQKKEGEKIWRLGIYESEELVASALVIKIKAKRGTFLFVPHGPILKSEVTSYKSKVLEVLLNKLRKIADEERASFIRIAPIWERNEENIKIFKDLKFKKAPIHMHPEVTWEMNINPSEEELLMGMRKTTRYLIRQAQKNSDIEIIQSQNTEELKRFDEIYCATAKRHHFVPFSLNYLKNQFSSFLADNQISIFLGKYKGEIVSSSVVVFWQNIGFYHHGASLSKYNRVPVSYLLQWEAIKEAKRRGCRKYNFWGIAPEVRRKHPWAGLTLFKMGFGGYRKEYVKTQDLPLKSTYWLTYFFEKLRKAKRGL